MNTYCLTDFLEILKKNSINKLSQNTIDIINILANEVGAPEYIKTPQFKNKAMGYTYNNENGNIITRRKKKNLLVDDEEWQNIRSFQATELKKKEGIETNIYVIRSYLNMITFNTYLKLKTDIIKEINIVKTTKTENDLLYLCNELFTIVSNNILYSDIYAKLYCDLLTDSSIFKKILTENFDKFNNMFNEIEYYDPEKDYNKFCENNKKNEHLRSLCTFYINLMKEGIIESEKICEIIINLFTILHNFISSNTKKNELDELSELLYIMIVNSYELIKKDHPNWAKEILTNIQQITKIKIKENTGITNKCIFKHMDILDEIS